MSLFEAIAHAFTTLPTGGFSTEARGVEAFGAASQWVIAGFMALAGANFALLYRLFVRGNPRPLIATRSSALLHALVLESLVLTIELWTEGVARGEEAVRAAVFQLLDDDHDGRGKHRLQSLAGLAAVVLVGPCSSRIGGSTSGSVKVVRHLLLAGSSVVSSTRPCIPRSCAGALNGVPWTRASCGRSRAASSLRGVFALGTLADADGARSTSTSGSRRGRCRRDDAGDVGPAFGFAGPMAHSTGQRARRHDDRPDVVADLKSSLCSALEPPLLAHLAGCAGPAASFSSR